MIRLQTCCTEDVVDHDLLQTSDRFVHGFGNKNALAGGKTTGLEDNLEAASLDILRGFVELRRRERFELCRRYRMAFHKVLGESLRAFHPGGKLCGTKNRYPGWPVVELQSCIE